MGTTTLVRAVGVRCKVKQYIIYTRVSTKRQGDSGLGLEAQQRDINLYLENYAQEPYEVIADLCDVASGTKVNRPKLSEAIELSAKTGATILVAKLDRISRDVEQIAGLIKRCDFIVASMPNADKFSLHIYAALAEQERDFISLRTKSAMAAAKERGVIFGGARPEAQKRHDAVKKVADANAKRVINIIKSFRKSNKSYHFIADEMNKLKIQTSRGGLWHGKQVLRYEQRISL